MESAAPLSRARLWRAQALIGAAPVLVWAGFHLWEQWASFGGRSAYAARVAATSHGAAAIATELLLAIAPALAWIGLELHLRRGEEPPALAGAMAEEPETARRLGLLVKAGSWLFFAWLLFHVGWLWWPKLVEGSDPIRSWIQLRAGMGAWAIAIPNAIGLTAFGLHVWGAVPRALVAFGLGAEPSTRRTTRLCAGLVAVAFVVLYAQLAGWHAAGAGTLWSLE
ncbi:MAG: hypothetical protein SangKO_023850 [Sandaracinaceae bacterium]|nr:MAG: hypothetical protein EVA89_17035 [Sandaracinaceae bacterium]